MPTIGSGQDYTLIQDWEDATDNDLSGGGIVTGELVGASAFNEDVDVAGATNADASNYRHLTYFAGNRYDAVADSGAYMTSGANDRTIDVNEPFFRITGIKIAYTGTGTRGSVRVQASSSDVLVESVLADCSTGSGDSTCFLRGGGTGHEFVNCIAIGSGGTASTGATTGFLGNGTSQVFSNCIAYNIDRGSSVGDGFSAGQARNCMAFGSGGSDFASTTDMDYIMSSDTTASTTNSFSSQTDTTIFVDPANWDFHLNTGDVNGDADGETQTLTRWDETDFDGDSHGAASTAWNYGVYETVGTAGATEDHNEDLDATEALTLALTDAQAETLEIAETEAFTYAQSNADTDTLEITESIGQAFAQSNSDTDALEATESEALAVSLSFSEALEATESETHPASQLVPDTDTLELTETLQLQLAYSFSDTLEATETDDEGTVTPANTEWRSILIPGNFWFMEQGAESLNLGGLWFNETTDVTDSTVTGAATLEVAEALTLGLAVSYGETLEATEADTEVEGQVQSLPETLELTESLSLGLSYSFADTLEATETDDESSLTSGSGARQILVPGAFWYVEAGTKDLNLSDLWFSEATSTPSGSVTSGDTLELSEGLSLQLAVTYGETLEATEADDVNEGGSGQAETPSETLEVTESLSLQLSLSPSETLEITESDDPSSSAGLAVLEFVQTDGSLSETAPTGFMPYNPVVCTARNSNWGSTVREAARIRWSFGDPGVISVTDPRPGMANRSMDLSEDFQGFSATFIYTSAGTYDVELIIDFSDGVQDTVSAQITIDSDTRTQVYIDPGSGTDSPASGGIGSPYNTIAYAITQDGDDTTYNINRGTTESITSGLGVGGLSNALFQDYGSGAKPIIYASTNTSFDIFDGSSTTNLVLGYNLEFRGSGHWDPDDVNVAVVDIWAGSFKLSGLMDCDYNATSVTSGILRKIWSGDTNTAGPVFINIDSSLGEGITQAHHYTPQGTDCVIVGAKTLGSGNEHLFRILAAQGGINGGGMAWCSWVMSRSTAAKGIRIQLAENFSMYQCFVWGANISFGYDGQIAQYVRLDGLFLACGHDGVSISSCLTYNLSPSDIHVVSSVIVANGGLQDFNPDAPAANNALPSIFGHSTDNDTGFAENQSGLGVYNCTMIVPPRDDSAYETNNVRNSTMNFMADSSERGIAGEWTIKNCWFLAPVSPADAPSRYWSIAAWSDPGEMFADCSYNIHPTDAQVSSAFGQDSGGNFSFTDFSTASNHSNEAQELHNPDDLFCDPNTVADIENDFDGAPGLGTTARTHADPTVFVWQDYRGVDRDQGAANWAVGAIGLEGANQSNSSSETLQITESIDVDAPGQAGESVTLELTEADTYALAMSSPETLEATEVGTYAVSLSFTEALQLTEDDTELEDVGNVTVPETLEFTEADTYAIALAFSEALQIEEGTDEVVADTDALEITETLALGLAYSFSATAEVTETDQQGTSGEISLDFPETLNLSEALTGLPIASTATLEITEEITTTATATNTVAMRLRAFIRTLFLRGWCRS